MSLEVCRSLCLVMTGTTLRKLPEGSDRSASGHDLVVVEDRAGLVAGQGHGNPYRNAGPDEAPHADSHGPNYPDSQPDRKRRHASTALVDGCLALPDPLGGLDGCLSAFREAQNGATAE